MAARGVVGGILQLPHVVSNAYLLDTGDGLVLVDTGIPGRTGSIAAEVERARRAVGRDLRVVAVTHAHADHAGSLAGVVRRFDVPVAIGREDAPVVRAGGVPPTPEPTGPLCRLMALASPRVSIEASRTDHLLDDGDAVPDAAELRALHTPGHTPGHLSYFWPEHGGVLFAGDVAVHYLGLRESFVHADRDRATETLARLAALDFEVAVFGHGPPIRGRANAAFRRLVERLAR